MTVRVVVPGRVVSDTSPIMNLAAVGQLGLLQALYQRVFVPDAVIEDLEGIGSEGLAPIVSGAISWVERRSVTNASLVDSLLLELDTGEAQAIALAVEMSAQLLLVDERRGRNVAARLDIKCIGTLGVLIEAKRKALVGAVKPILDDMIAKAGFWVGGSLYTRVLREVQE